MPAVQRLVEEDRLPHLLFYGPPGTGKTTTILAIARQMYGASMSSMTLEVSTHNWRSVLQTCELTLIPSRLFAA